MTEHSDSSDKDAVTTRRGIRSFVLRQGRMTEGQKKAYERCWPKFGLTRDQGMICLLYTSPSPRDRQKSRMPSSA